MAYATTDRLAIQAFSAGTSAGDHRSSRGILRESRCLRATSPAAGAGAGRQGAFDAGGRHDRPDRAGAGAALRAAAEALVDLRRRARAFRAGIEALPDDVLGQEIARADDHPSFRASDQNGIVPVSLTGPGMTLPSSSLRRGSGSEVSGHRAGACRTEPDPHPSTPACAARHIQAFPTHGNRNALSRKKLRNQQLRKYLN